MRYFLLSAILISLAALPARALDGYDGPPRGLDGQRAIDYHHLTEGADSFPFDWVLHLKSASFKTPDGQPMPLLDTLESKFGFLKSPDHGDYLSSTIGLSIGWTNSTVDAMDAKASEASVPVRPGEGGTKATKVVGTSCSLCHSGGWNVGGKFYRVEGAPSRVDSMGYFEELARATLNLLAKKDLMAQFLKDLNVANPEEEAKEQVHFFFREVGKDSAPGAVDLGQISGQITMLLASHGRITRLHKAGRAITASLERLYRLTYHLSADDNIGDMKERLAVLGKLCSGDDPRAAVTYPGPARFDAFDRLAAATIPGVTGLNFDAPVRYPPCWAMKYSAMVHYNANTNAVLMRNAGEAVGLGAVVTSKDWDSSVNFRNLDRIEKHFYDIKVPQWEKLFADQPALAIDAKKAARGKEIYEASCKGCHETSERVGPTHQLYVDQLFPQDKIGTDNRQATNLDPLGEQLNQDLRKLTLGTRGRFYAKYNIDEETRKSWELRDIRGGEFFRWTHNGDSTQQALYGNNYGDVKPGLIYRARHLSGMWAAAPFLHNGSVPTLMDLLEPASKRPKYFRMFGYDYDTTKMGIRAQPLDSCPPGDRNCFDTTIAGNDNHGHEGPEFGTSLSRDDKLALIEYLKVLPPVPEYAWEQ